MRLGSGRVCLGTWRFPSASGGLPPRLLPPFEGGWVHCPAPEAPLTRGMPKGPRVFLANSGRVWATALRPVPPEKGHVPYMPVRWGVHQIPQITIGLTPLQVSGSTSAGRVICGMDLAECVSVPGNFPRPQGASPQAFTSFGRVGLIARLLRRP